MQAVSAVGQLCNELGFQPELASAVHFLSRAPIDDKPAILRMQPRADSVSALPLGGDENPSLKVKIDLGDAPTVLPPIKENT